MMLGVMYKRTLNMYANALKIYSLVISMRSELKTHNTRDMVGGGVNVTRVQLGARDNKYGYSPIISRHVLIVHIYITTLCVYTISFIRVCVMRWNGEDAYNLIRDNKREYD